MQIENKKIFFKTEYYHLCLKKYYLVNIKGNDWFIFKMSECCKQFRHKLFYLVRTILINI